MHETSDGEPNPVEAEIQDFRTQYNDALLSNGHPEHGRRTNELNALYSKLYPDNDGHMDELTGETRPPNEVDSAAEEAMQPLAATEYSIGPDSDFGLNVNQEQYGWDGELETDARQVFAAAALNDAEARTVAICYADTLPETFDREEAVTKSVQALQAYGDVDRVLQGTNRMLKAVAGDKLYKFIGESGLGSHPRFVSAAAEYARRRGYF